MNIKVLIVDDCNFSVQVMRRALAGWSVDNEITVATDGQAAADLLGVSSDTPAQTDPDIMVLDLEMPRMNGIELLTALRKDRRYQNLPVVCYTNSDNTNSQRAANALFVSDYLLKSAQFSEIIPTLERALYKNWAGRQSA